ncbi:MAG TPA: phage tail sheath subtilisin-like domain-containing protein [Thermoanaerobaculia bacterium]|nr:phage tail sheath subtilisin-like domain-containing protein [Thermoanaerobaculia bacterium]
MPTYLRPGVYVEEIPSGSKPIGGVGTSTAAFLGYTTRGAVGEPTLIFKWDDYQSLYGGIRDTGSSVQGDAMGHSISAFFQNGGTAAYVVRLAEGGSRARGSILQPDADSTLTPDDAILTFTATNDGAWGNDLRVRLTPKTVGGTTSYVAVVGTGAGDDFKPLETFSGISLTAGNAQFVEGKINGVSGLVTVKAEKAGDEMLGVSLGKDLTGLDPLSLIGKGLTVTVDGTARTVTFDATQITSASKPGDVATVIQTQVRGTDPAAPGAVKDFTAVASANRLVLTSGSRLATSAVVVTGTASASLGLGAGNGGTERTGQQSLNNVLGSTPSRTEADLNGGADGGAAGSAAFQAALAKLEKVRDVSIVVLPGRSYDAAGKAFVDFAVAHAQKMRNRVVIADPPQGAQLVTENDVNALSLPTSTYSVLYYPWLKVANPYYNAEKNPGAPVTVLVPPSGFAAGMWSRIDGRRGVWKAPAGVETALLGVAGTEYQVEDGEQEQLNPLGVNCIRKLPSFGPVIWGTRTLSTNSDPEWRYVPVRRTAIFIEQSVYNGIQWAVFEPNDHRLWSSLRVNIDSFMNGLFRAGAFQGDKASDAYFVRCGLGDTMTQGDIDRGQVIVVVGFAPLKPAEFVIVRIQQTLGQ